MSQNESDIFFLYLGNIFLLSTSNFHLKLLVTCDSKLSFISIPRVPPPFNFPSPSFCCHPVLLPPPSTAPPKTLSFFRSIIHAAVTVGIKGPWRSLRQPRSRSSRTGWWETGSPPRSGRVCVHVCVSESGYSSGRSTYDMWRMSRDGAVVSQNDYRKFIENRKGSS